MLGSSPTAASSSARGSTATSASPAGSPCAAARRRRVAHSSTDATPLLRVAQLAIHLDRTQNEALTLNKQQHMEPLWGVGDEPGDFVGYLAEQVGVDREDVLSWDVMTHPVQPSTRLGRARELIAAPRLDNLATSYAGVRALLDAVATEPAHVPVLVLFDHEEIGSTSERGATSTLLPSVLERIVTAGGGTRDDYWRALAATVIASGDMGHATHPNYADRHEPMHQIRVNGGPVLKVNTNLRYATDSVGAAAFRLACEQAGRPHADLRHPQRPALRLDRRPGDVVADRRDDRRLRRGRPVDAQHARAHGRRGPGHVCRRARRSSPPGRRAPDAGAVRRCGMHVETSWPTADPRLRRRLRVLHAQVQFASVGRPARRYDVRPGRARPRAVGLTADCDEAASSSPPTADPSGTAHRERATRRPGGDRRPPPLAPGLGWPQPTLGPRTAPAAGGTAACARPALTTRHAGLRRPARFDSAVRRSGTLFRLLDARR